MTKLEQIEKLREKASVSYDEAKEAYETCDGDLLDAIIYLEKQGKVEPPKGNGYHKSAGTADENDHNEESQRSRTDGDGISDTLKNIGSFIVGVINKANAISFEVLKDDDSKGKCPLTVLALLLLFLPWVTIPLIIIGVVMGYRYRFNGVEIDSET